MIEKGIELERIEKLLQIIRIFFTKIKEIPDPTAKRILALLRDNGILTQIRKPSGRRPGTYAFSELINTAEGKKVI